MADNKQQGDKGTRKKITPSPPIDIPRRGGADDKDGGSPKSFAEHYKRSKNTDPSSPSIFGSKPK